MIKRTKMHAVDFLRTEGANARREGRVVVLCGNAGAVEYTTRPDWVDCKNCQRSRELRREARERIKA